MENFGYGGSYGYFTHQFFIQYKKFPDTTYNREILKEWYKESFQPEVTLESMEKALLACRYALQKHSQVSYTEFKGEKKTKVFMSSPLTNGGSNSVSVVQTFGDTALSKEAEAAQDKINSIMEQFPVLFAGPPSWVHIPKKATVEIVTEYRDTIRELNPRRRIKKEEE